MVFEVTNEMWVALLFFVTIFAVAVNVLSRFLGKNVSIVVGIVVGLIAVRFLSTSHIDFLFKNYGMAGVLTLSLLPFVIVFVFVYSNEIFGPIRKAIWAFYCAVMVFVLQTNKTFSSESLTYLTMGVIFLTAMMIIFDKFIKERISVWLNLRRRF